MALDLPHCTQSKPINMKRLTLSLVTVLIASFTLQAQLNTTFGIKATPGFRTFHVKAESGGVEQVIDGSLFGVQAGGIVDLGFTPNFSIQPQLLFAYKGGKLAGSYNANIIAIDVPINFLYKREGFFMGGGPNISYALSGKAEAESGGTDIDDLYEDNATLTLKRFEIGAVINMGYTFPSGFTIATTYTRGLNDILDEGPDDYSMHTSQLGLTLGYMFGGKTAKKK
jgi:hypothetical protein